jgi:DNA primase
MEAPEAAFVKDYVLARGTSPEMIDRFKLGYAPADRAWLFRFLTKKGYSEEFLASSGLFSKNNSRSAFFSDRLIFPIADRQGRIVAFGGRILRGEGPKYLNSGESFLYKKRETLFAIDLALPEMRKTK